MPLLLIFLFLLPACQTARKAPEAEVSIEPATPLQLAEKAFEEGVRAMRERDFEKAERAFFECLIHHPTSLRCHWEMGWSRFSERRWLDAEDSWAAIAEIKPEYPGLIEAFTQLRKYLEIDEKARARARRAPLTLRRAPPAEPLIRIRAAGDTMLGTDFPDNKLPPDEGQSPLRQVEALLQDADVTFINHEGTFCSGGKSEKCENGGNCYSFRTPPRFASYLQQAGVEVASIANNHILDFGDECRWETAHTLQSAGIKWSGPPGSFASLPVKGKNVAVVAFHSADHSNDSRKLKEAKSLIRAVRRSHDIVLVSFHGGGEGFAALHVPKKEEFFYGENRGDVHAFAHAAIDAGAHLVLGHGPHVPRGVEFYRGRPILYSLGNFATYGTFNLSGFNSLGMLAEITLTPAGRFHEGRIIPLKQVGRGMAMPDSQAATVDLVRYLSQEDFKGSAAVIARDGTFSSRRASNRRRAVGRPRLRRAF